MKPSAEKVYYALRQGHQLSQGNGQKICGQTAITQRCSELKNKHGIDVRSRWDKSPSGSRYLVYFLPPELCDLVPRKRTETIVKAHVRRFPELAGYESEEQASLF